jgi:hypothetical protein
MYARLWWKDARQFWPIWVFLAIAAAVTQGLLLHYLGQDARQGALGCLALICASLYAFATGAVAFAGEREAGTLHLLDILPVDRRVVWASKLSFSLVTTLALALLLLAMAAVGSDQWKPQGPLSLWEALSFGTIVLLALGWGLFWSAILSTALTAAVMAICCTGVSLSFLMSRLDNVFLNRVDLSIFVVWYLFIFLATLTASVVIFAQVMQWKRLRLEFRSPVVVNLADLPSARQAQLRIQSSVTTVLTPRAMAQSAEASATDQWSRPSWVTESRALAWQTLKQGWKTWFLLVVIGLVLPGPFYLASIFLDSIWLILLSTGVSLVAGASVFGLENRGCTQRFLAYHGARPSLVWLVKLLIWGVGMIILWGPLVFMAQISFRHMRAVSIENWLFGIFVMPLYFSIALLCGMAIRRSITAVVISLVIGSALTIPLIALITVQMLPEQGLLVIPVGLLVVSWAWSGDWLLDRPGSGRWLRLGLLLTGMFTLIVSSYAGFRAWSISDVGPIAPPSVWLEATSASLPADQNAADLYREAGRKLIGPFKDSPEFLDRNRGLLDLLRQAAARSYCRFLEPQKLTVLDRPDLPPFGPFALLLALDTSERQNHGDLGGAWDNIMGLFRMARHSGEGTGLGLNFANDIWVERTALGVALEWAVAHGQTPERLQTALTAYHGLPKMPAAADIVRAEANIVENTLDLPTSRLRDWVFEGQVPHGNSRSQPAFVSMLFDLATTPWERIRARRVNRLLASAAIQAAMYDPWQRSKQLDPEIDYAQKTSRNAMMLIRGVEGYIEANDRNEVGRRGLVLVLALREWQLRHRVQFPKSLDALVPEELAGSPLDPYSGQPFGYVRSHGQEVPLLRHALGAARYEGHSSAPGSWLLYSVGPNRSDDGGITFKDRDHRTQLMDIVFEIPPVEGDAVASKGQRQRGDSTKDQPEPRPTATASPKP